MSNLAFSYNFKIPQFAIIILASQTKFQTLLQIKMDPFGNLMIILLNEPYLGWNVA